MKESGKGDSGGDDAEKRMEPPLSEGIDYYLDSSGYMVFTAAYHIKRGFCCGNNCKHCPFGNDILKGS